MDVITGIILFSVLGVIFLFLAIQIYYAVKYTSQAESPTAPKPQFTTELEALIAIEENTRQSLELLRQQNKKSLWSMLYLGSIPPMINSPALIPSRPADD